jgi:hypothetical protein
MLDHISQNQTVQRLFGEWQTLIGTNNAGRREPFARDFDRLRRNVHTMHFAPLQNQLILEAPLSATDRPNDLAILRDQAKHILAGSVWVGVCHGNSVFVLPTPGLRQGRER